MNKARNIFITNSRNKLNINKCLQRRLLYSFVPQHSVAGEKEISILQSFLDTYSHILVLTGAGVSTESGIPDYRSKGVGLYDRSTNRPVVYKHFIENSQTRKRYWARNFVGWPRFSSLQPNEAHYCLKNWENWGRLNWLVTQNVDRLHHKAGSEKITELHGSSYLVKCLNCGYSISRYLFQDILRRLNPDFYLEAIEIRPDGDVHLEPSLVNNFCVPPCDRCGGILKPDVVFFGETVPKRQVQETYSRVENSDAVLVLGSSLEVFSGYRFILAASESKKPIAIVNIGPTRADHLAAVKLNSRCGDILPKIDV